jgi:hypothetical protein
MQLDRCEGKTPQDNTFAPVINLGVYDMIVGVGLSAHGESSSRNCNILCATEHRGPRVQQVTLV